MDEVVDSGLRGVRIRRPNENLTWASFNRLWSAAQAGSVLRDIVDDVHPS